MTRDTGKPDSPAAGEVYRYPYLWRREHKQGEDGGRKDRPACIAITLREDAGTCLYLFPITTKAPEPGYRINDGTLRFWLFKNLQPLPKAPTSDVVEIQPVE